MGAAASVIQVYDQAYVWFSRYFDESLYIKDFESIDKDADGGISYTELEKWIKAKAVKDDSWSCFLPHPDIIAIAHSQASKTVRKKDSDDTQRIVNLFDFRDLLIHLFVISILWVHFKNADDWIESYDHGNLTLSLEEFQLACKSFSAANANEQLSEAQFTEDFKLLDSNGSNSLDFLEVCSYCCKFVRVRLLKDKTVDAVLQQVNKKTSLIEELLHEKEELSLDEAPSELVQALTASCKESHQLDPVDVKNFRAVSFIKTEQSKNLNTAGLVVVRVTTENQLKEILG